MKPKDEMEKEFIDVDADLESYKVWMVEHWVHQMYLGPFDNDPNQHHDFHEPRYKSLMIEFDSNIPDDIQKSLELYLLRGIMPGGFLEALLARDYNRAIDIADLINRERFWHIATWIRREAPKACWGDYNDVHNWTKDKNGCRTEYVNKVEKQFVWTTLSEKE